MLPEARRAGQGAALVHYGVKVALELELPLVGKLGPVKLMGLGALGSYLWDKHKHPQPSQPSIAYAPLANYGGF